MQNLFPKRLLITLVLMASGPVALGNVLTLDDFSRYQEITDNFAVGSSSSSVALGADSDLSNVTRTFVGEATPNGRNGSEITIVAQDGLLRISNGPGSAGAASVQWDFSPTDFTQYGTGLLLEVAAIDLNVQVEMVVNGIASSGVKTFTDVTDFLADFGDFSNNQVFVDASSIRLNFSGPRAWDGLFRFSMQPILQNPPIVASIPLPPAYLSMGLALLGLVGISRRKRI